ncbi:type IV toxin-antitoxin system AbiEi family antitoxin domain-containing protein [Rhizorhapis sp. SPR117]|uniref:type IV toxin-antitoxin system AbiEi family antitoxin domain-containing protein n=1 Tax=Rhizorhapis sp. SPR117 TaxID=2912611 RepID=UPI001F2049ED|nr:type IV toxin-antitoxin system AbiEi family antitoxin domain-containing protein [Rhizorhapis sp. SPR117]
MESVETLSDQAIAIVRSRGIARARDFREAGIPPSSVARLCEQGQLVRLARGLYQMADAEEIDAAHNLAEAARLAPNGVIALLSALQYHELTTQLPHAVWICFHHKARIPQTLPFCVEAVRASGEAFEAGRMTAYIEGVAVPIYDPAKTIVDCFKYRSRVGLDVAIEALRDGLRQRKATHADLRRYANICRVQNVMRPYLESIS